MAAEVHILLAQGQLLTGRDTDLLPDKVEIRDLFGHGVLHLDARIHLDKEELAVLVEIFDRPDTKIAQLFNSGARDLADPGALVVGEGRGQGFFQNLLVPALQRAVAFAQMDDIAMGVSGNLDFDMAGQFEIPLEVHGIVAERGLGLCLCRGDRLVRDRPPSAQASCRVRRHPRRP